MFAVTVTVFGLFFSLGYMRGRRDRSEAKAAPPAAAPSKDGRSIEGFLDPECNAPFGPDTFIGTEEREKSVQPTEEQMLQIRRLLPKDTRIHDSLRVDADPPLAFVLHQPQPRTSRVIELTMFRFKKQKVESEDWGSYCFIPDFLTTPDGQAIGGWMENPYGGNAWGGSSLRTLLIKKDEIVHPEIESEPWQVAKYLDMDKDVPVLITLDTRFEFFGGLCHACSPIHRNIFELNRRGVWVDATARHRRLVETWIQEDVESLQEAMAGQDKTEVGTAALNLYLNAETAGCAARYRNTVKGALDSIGWRHFTDMIDEAARRRCLLIDLDRD